MVIGMMGGRFAEKSVNTERDVRGVRREAAAFCFTRRSLEKTDVGL
jgi:hypothetical protein